jgi:succinate dehydrogenase/fumarate reductase flavoprotein subunit
VKRLLSPVLLLSLFLLSAGCGNVFVRGAIEAGSTIQGSVSVVQLGNTLNGMETVQVTFVTLLQNGTSSTIGFCGDQGVLFPLDQTVRVNFNPGQPCATVIVVVVVI